MTLRCLAKPISKYQSKEVQEFQVTQRCLAEPISDLENNDNTILRCLGEPIGNGNCMKKNDLSVPWPDARRY